MQALRPVQTVAPTEEPVTLAEAKQHLRVEHTEDDDLIGIYISAAVAKLDGQTGILGRCMVTQTWRSDFTDFPTGYLLRLPFPDLQSATVAYEDTNGDTQAFTAFQTIEDELGGALYLNDGAVWPAVDDVRAAVSVTAVYGYGAASAVPAALKSAVLLHVGTMYEHRTTLSGEKVAANFAYEALVAPYRRAVG